MHDNIISALACDGNDVHAFYTVDWDGYLCQCHVDESSMRVTSDEIDAHKGIINDMTALAGQHALCTVGVDGFARVWDTRTLSVGCSAILPIGQIGSAVAWHPERANELVIGREDGILSVFDIRTFQPIVSLPFPSRIRRVQNVCGFDTCVYMCALEDASLGMVFSSKSEETEEGRGDVLCKGERFLNNPKYIRVSYYRPS